LEEVVVAFAVLGFVAFAVLGFVAFDIVGVVAAECLLWCLELLEEAMRIVDVCQILCGSHSLQTCSTLGAFACGWASVEQKVGKGHIFVEERVWRCVNVDERLLEFDLPGR
jgi:hypothetical protein